MAVAVVAALIVLGATSVADAVARTPSISGNSWVALLIIGVLVVTIYMLIMGTLHVEKRDARLGRGSRNDNGGWFGFFPTTPDDDDDSPDHHHHGGGGDGGEGGEGGEGGWWS